MKLAELKSEFHNLIDQTNDPEIIEQFYKAMSESLRADGSLWRSLSSEQQKGVLDAYGESEDENNLMSFDEIKEKYANWS
jgi:DNA repair ATPase RecN